VLNRSAVAVLTNHILFLKCSQSHIGETGEGFRHKYGVVRARGIHAFNRQLEKCFIESISLIVEECSRAVPALCAPIKLPVPHLESVFLCFVVISELFNS